MRAISIAFDYHITEHVLLSIFRLVEKFPNKITLQLLEVAVLRSTI